MRTAETPSTLAKTRVACGPSKAVPYVAGMRSIVILERGERVGVLLDDAMSDWFLARRRIMTDRA